MTRLLERDADLAALRASANAASEGRGSVVTVTGEAGIGKSSLVRAWSDDPGAGCRVLVGLCDDLLTPRTLGPLHDIARRIGGALADAVAGSDTAAVCEALLVELNHPLHPTALVLEDVHWADEATLDVLRYVGRRIHALRGLLVVTYRDEEAGQGHPLRSVLGALSTAKVEHLRPEPLSAEAVRTLARAAGRDAEDVLGLTGGHPFFVAELVADPNAIPTSVAASVLSRLQSLSAAGRNATELLSVLPRPASLSFLQALGLDLDVVAEAEFRGLLVVSGDRVGFRHELTRVAILDHLPGATRARYHEAALEQLMERDADAPDVLHHAIVVRRGDVIVRYGLAAAREAYRAGSHREAAEHQRHVLGYGELLGSDTLAHLLEEHAWTLYHLHRFAAALAAASRAVGLGRELKDDVGLARSLATLSRMEYLTNDPQAAMSSASAAVDVAHAAGDDAVLAEARLAKASLQALLDQPEVARGELGKVMVAAQRLGRLDLASLALNYLAVCGPGEGEADDLAVTRLIRAIELARQGGHLEAAARAYTNLVSEMVWRSHPDRWRWYEEAVAFLTDHDFPSFRFNVVAQGSHQLVSEGRWTDAETALRELLVDVDDLGVFELVALEALARLLVRRGDPEADAVLERAWQLALRSEAAQYIGPVAAIRAEMAFLEGNAELAAEIYQAVPIDDLEPSTRGELLTYLRRAGLEPPPTQLRGTDPWADVLAGDAATAAQGWAELGNPYERALALQEVEDEAAIREALRILDSLGAVPAAGLVRQRLRQLGVRAIPRGPTSQTRSNPAGLTARQLEVLDMLGEGLTNAQIAQRLVLSIRTVDHHVSAILQKLGVSTRHEAVAAAQSTGR